MTLICTSSSPPFVSPNKPSSSSSPSWPPFPLAGLGVNSRVGPAHESQIPLQRLGASGAGPLGLPSVRLSVYLSVSVCLTASLSFSS
jgi:hypothetical protein